MTSHIEKLNITLKTKTNTENYCSSIVYGQKQEPPFLENKRSKLLFVAVTRN